MISVVSELRRFCFVLFIVFVCVGVMLCINISCWVDIGIFVRWYICFNCKLSDICCIFDCMSGMDMYECSFEVEGW